MTERELLLRAVCADPDDDTVRLAYADFLDERGERERAEFVRVQMELARVGVCRDECRNRIDYRCRACDLRARERELLPVNGRNARNWFDGGWWGDGLCNVCPDGSVTIIDPATGARFDPPPRMRYRFSRGFVSAIICTQERFLAHAAAVFAAHPVTRVTLSDRVPDGNESGAWWYRGPAVPPQGWNDFLNPDLYAAVIAARRESGEPYSQDWLFDSAADAVRWLSAGAVAYGRELAGLPPLRMPSNAATGSALAGRM